MWIIYSLATFLLAVLAQLLIRTAGIVGNGVYAFVISGLVFGFGLLGTLYRHDGWQVAAAASLVYGFVCEVYVFLFTFAYSSISANLLVHLVRTPMTRDQIDALYDNRAMIAERIDGLNRVGLVDEIDGQLRTTAQGRRLAAIFNACRSFFGHRE